MLAPFLSKLKTTLVQQSGGCTAALAVPCKTPARSVVQLVCRLWLTLECVPMVWCLCMETLACLNECTALSRCRARQHCVTALQAEELAQEG